MMRSTRLFRVMACLLALFLILPAAAAPVAAAAVAPAIGVQYNGAPVTFKDAAPKLIDGRTMVPMRQVFETMGAKVNYNDADRSVHVEKGAVRFSFTLGGKTLNLTDAGENRVVNMDVPPYLDKATSRTYVPVRFMAESLGYTVGWDSAAKTAVVINAEPLLQTADKDFSILGKVLKSPYPADANLEAATHLSFDVKLPATGNMPGHIFGTADASSLQNQSLADMAFRLMCNYDGLSSQLSAEERQKLAEAFAPLRDMKMDMRMDMSKGVLYIQSAALSKMAGTAENAWIKIDSSTNAAAPVPGLNQKQLFQSEVSMRELLEAVFTGSESSLTVNSWKEFQMVYALLVRLMGDQAFVTGTEDGRPTYTLTLDRQKLLGAIAEAALKSGIKPTDADMAELQKAMEAAQFDINLKITELATGGFRTESNGKIVADAMNLNWTVTSDLTTQKMSFSFNDGKGTSMSLTGDSTIAVTQKTPVGQPPADAKIVDFETLF